MISTRSPTRADSRPRAAAERCRGGAQRGVVRQPEVGMGGHPQPCDRGPAGQQGRVAHHERAVRRRGVRADGCRPGSKPAPDSGSLSQPAWARGRKVPTTVTVTGRWTASRPVSRSRVTRSPTVEPQPRRGRGGHHGLGRPRRDVRRPPAGGQVGAAVEGVAGREVAEHASVPCEQPHPGRGGARDRWASSGRARRGRAPPPAAGWPRGPVRRDRRGRPSRRRPAAASARSPRRRRRPASRRAAATRTRAGWWRP